MYCILFVMYIVCIVYCMYCIMYVLYPLSFNAILNDNKMTLLVIIFYPLFVPVTTWNLPHTHSFLIFTVENLDVVVIWVSLSATATPIHYKQTEAAKKEREIPPYNGWGSEEDSRANCLKLIAQAPKRDFIKFMKKDRWSPGLASELYLINCSL